MSSSSSTSISQMVPNVLMCRYVCSMLPSTRQAHLRSAGSVGYDAFEELVALGDVPAYVEVVTGGSDARLGALINVPIRGVKKLKRRMKKIPSNYVIVFWERAMRRRSILQPAWSHLPCVSIRYHCDPHADPSRFVKRFLLRCSTASHIELTGFEHSEETPHGALYTCSNLSVADLSCFCSAKIINHSFMVGYKGSVDLGPLSNVHTIRSNMFHTSNFTPNTIDLSPLRNVTSIGDYFLGSCRTLKAVDLSPFTNLETIGHGFLISCNCLESIDFSPLVKVVSIGSLLLSRCDALTHVDLRPLKGVQSIDHGILTGCAMLTSITLPTFDHPNDVIGPQFLSSCISLQDIDLSPLHNMTILPGSFLATCTALTRLDLSHFTQVHTVGGYLLYECTGLTSVDLHGLRNVRVLGVGFMGMCPNIVHIDMSPMVLLTRAEKESVMGWYFPPGVVTYELPTWFSSSSSSVPRSCCMM